MNDSNSTEKPKLQPMQLTKINKLLRWIWFFVWIILYRPTPVFLHGWRRFLLRCFGAKIHAGAHPYPSAKIWAPWNLVMEHDSCLGSSVDCYCVAPIILKRSATVSQYSYLCTASHDLSKPDLPLIAAPIVIESHAWVTADVFIGPGVTIGEGAVVGARATIVKSVRPWSITVGNPQRVIGQRPKFEIAQP